MPRHRSGKPGRGGAATREVLAPLGEPPVVGPQPGPSLIKLLSGAGRSGHQKARGEERRDGVREHDFAGEAVGLKLALTHLVVPVADLRLVGEVLPRVRGSRRPRRRSRRGTRTRDSRGTCGGRRRRGNRPRRGCSDRSWARAYGLAEPSAGSGDRRVRPAARHRHRPRSSDRSRTGWRH